MVSAAVDTVRLVPMRRRHLRSVLRIESQVYPRPWSLGLYLGELALPEERRIYVVARAGASVIGHAGLMFAAEDGHVTTIAVDPRWQRRSIGAHLLLSLSRTAIARGAHDLTLEVRVSNEPAQALYRRFGFVDAGTRKGYYSENREDALVMWANDVHTDTYRQHLDEIEAVLAADRSGRGVTVLDEMPRLPSHRGAGGEGSGR